MKECKRPESPAQLKTLVAASGLSWNEVNKRAFLRFAAAHRHNDECGVFPLDEEGDTWKVYFPDLKTWVEAPIGMFYREIGFHAAQVCEAEFTDGTVCE